MTKQEANLTKADEDKKVPPPAAEDKKEEKPEEEDDKVEKTLDRVISVLGKIADRQDRFEAALKSAYPQKFEGMYDDQEAGVDINPEGKASLDEKVHQLAAPEQSVKNTKNTQATAGAFVGPDDGKMGKALEEFKAKLLAEVKAAAAETIKASTPAPMSYKQAQERASADRMEHIKGLVYKAVEHAHKTATFSSDAENGEGGFLALSAPQQEDHYLFLRKLSEEA